MRCQDDLGRRVKQPFPWPTFDIAEVAVDTVYLQLLIWTTQLFMPFVVVLTPVVLWLHFRWLSFQLKHLTSRPFVSDSSRLRVALQRVLCCGAMLYCTGVLFFLMSSFPHEPGCGPFDSHQSPAAKLHSKQKFTEPWESARAVKDVLEMTGTFPPHQVLKAKGLLLNWGPEMLTIFVSHQWLGLKHPDHYGVQLGVLQGILRNLMRKTVKIEVDIASQFWGGAIQEEVLGKIGEGYVWLDYFSVPQLVEHPDVHDLADEQLRYVRSIPSYVDLCDVFVSLVPPAAHHDTGAPCSLHSF
ncbi:warA [Symbiodinium sp. CCMP2592]|nr:warA [Symbiodinium sp. CCMP2592]